MNAIEIFGETVSEGFGALNNVCPQDDVLYMNAEEFEPVTVVISADGEGLGDEEILSNTVDYVPVGGETIADTVSLAMSIDLPQEPTQVKRSSSEDHQQSGPSVVSSGQCQKSTHHGHSSKHKLQCPKCPRKYSAEHDLARHLKKHYYRELKQRKRAKQLKAYGSLAPSVPDSAKSKHLDRSVSSGDQKKAENIAVENGQVKAGKKCPVVKEKPNDVKVVPDKRSPVLNGERNQKSSGTPKKESGPVEQQDSKRKEVKMSGKPKINEPKEAVCRNQSTAKEGVPSRSNPMVERPGQCTKNIEIRKDGRTVSVTKSASGKKVIRVSAHSAVSRQSAPCSTTVPHVSSLAPATKLKKFAKKFRRKKLVTFKKKKESQQPNQESVERNTAKRKMGSENEHVTEPEVGSTDEEDDSCSTSEKQSKTKRKPVVQLKRLKLTPALEKQLEAFEKKIGQPENVDHVGHVPDLESSQPRVVENPDLSESDSSEDSNLGSLGPKSDVISVPLSSNPIRNTDASNSHNTKLKASVSAEQNTADSNSLNSSRTTVSTTPDATTPDAAIPESASLSVSTSPRDSPCTSSNSANAKFSEVETPKSPAKNISKATPSKSVHNMSLKYKKPYCYENTSDPEWMDSGEEPAQSSDSDYECSAPKRRKRASKVTKMQCNTCDAQFTVSAALNLHKKTHQLYRQKTCSLCGKTFGRRTVLRSHLKLHVKLLESLKCFQCFEEFNDEEEMNSHQCAAAEDDFNSHSDSNFQFDDTLIAENDSTTDGNEMASFTCGDCGKLMSFYMYKSHGKMCHRKRNRMDIFKQSKDAHSAQNTPNESMKALYMKKKVKQYGCGSRYPCGFCPANFDRQEKLDAHLLKEHDCTASSGSGGVSGQQKYVFSKGKAAKSVLCSHRKESGTWKDKNVDKIAADVINKLLLILDSKKITESETNLKLREISDSSGVWFDSLKNAVQTCQVVMKNSAKLSTEKKKTLLYKVLVVTVANPSTGVETKHFMKKSSNGHIYQCNYCDEEYRIDDLLKHLKNHEEVASQPCEACEAEAVQIAESSSSSLVEAVQETTDSPVPSKADIKSATSQNEVISKAGYSLMATTSASVTSSSQNSQILCTPSTSISSTSVPDKRSHTAAASTASTCVTNTPSPVSTNCSLSSSSDSNTVSSGNKTNHPSHTTKASISYVSPQAKVVISSSVRTETVRTSIASTASQKIVPRNTVTTSTGAYVLSKSPPSDVITSVARVLTMLKSQSEKKTESNTELLVSNKNSSAALVSNKNSSAALGSDKNSSAALVNDKNSSAALVNDKNSSAALVTDKNSSAALVTDKNSSAVLVSEKNSSAALVSDKNSSAVLVSNKNLPASLVNDKNSSAALVNDKNSSAALVNDKNSSAALVNDKNSSAVLVSNKNLPASLVNDKNSSAALVNDKNSSAVLVSNKNSSAALVSDREPSAAPVSDRELSAALGSNKNSPAALVSGRKPSVLVSKREPSAALFTDSSSEDSDPDYLPDESDDSSDSSGILITNVKSLSVEANKKSSLNENTSKSPLVITKKLIQASDRKQNGRSSPIIIPKGKVLIPVKNLETVANKKVEQPSVALRDNKRPSSALLPNKCSLCDKSFLSAESLKCHMFLLHDDSPAAGKKIKKESPRIETQNGILESNMVMIDDSFEVAERDSYDLDICPDNDMTESNMVMVDASEGYGENDAYDGSVSSDECAASRSPESFSKRPIKRELTTFYKGSKSSEMQSLFKHPSAARTLISTASCSSPRGGNIFFEDAITSSTDEVAVSGPSSGNPSSPSSPDALGSLLVQRTVSANGDAKMKIWSEDKNLLSCPLFISYDSRLEQMVDINLKIKPDPSANYLWQNTGCSSVPQKPTPFSAAIKDVNGEWLGNHCSSDKSHSFSTSNTIVNDAVKDSSSHAMDLSSRPVTKTVDTGNQCNYSMMNARNSAHGSSLGIRTVHVPIVPEHRGELAKKLKDDDEEHVVYVCSDCGIGLVSSDLISSHLKSSHQNKLGKIKGKKPFVAVKFSVASGECAEKVLESLMANWDGEPLNLSSKPNQQNDSFKDSFCNDIGSKKPPASVAVKVHD